MLFEMSDRVTMRSINVFTSTTTTTTTTIKGIYVWRSSKSLHCFRSIGAFNASEDLPIDYEDALLLWINKVSAACVRSHAITQHHKTSSPVRVFFPHTTTDVFLLGNKIHVYDVGVK